MSDKGLKIGMDGKRAVANNTGLGLSLIHI